MGTRYYIRACTIWLIGATFFFYEFFLRVLPNSLHQDIVDSFHATAFSFSLFGGAFYLCYSLLQVPVGFLFDKYGIKKSLFFATITCALGALLFSLTSSLYVAVFARCLMGIGAAFGFLGLLIISTQWFPMRYMGILSGSTQILGTLGPILAGGPLLFLVNYLDSWRLVILISAIVGIFLAALILVFVKEGAKTVETLSKQELNEIKSNLLNKKLITIYFYAFFIYCSIPTLGAIWGVSLLETKGLSITQASYSMAFLWLGLGIGSPFFGLMYDKFKDKINMLFVVSLLGFICVCSLLFLHLNQIISMILLLLIGCAAAGQTLSFTVIANYMERKPKSIFFGINNTVVMFSGFIVPIIVGVLVNSFNLDISLALSILPIAFLVALIVSLKL
ncbi:MFS sugar transporter [Francisella persica ATCC VR-331]|uniref:Lysosomal dipeptide transporter MFSD1 n=1 Tax=Francisella persica ATCC VR-331 TaxID=1086726 RepID=A0AAC8VDT7_9GAMM|nr:MFS transporter [Francisella persica]ALB01776.1 MFS sugar transporter [Francisella persica ATCC VR-331]ANH78082.1 MFS sugar transporter [Francisella persica ATCC VR-331]